MLSFYHLGYVVKKVNTVLGQYRRSFCLYPVMLMKVSAGLKLLDECPKERSFQGLKCYSDNNDND